MSFTKVFVSLTVLLSGDNNTEHNDKIQNIRTQPIFSCITRGNSVDRLCQRITKILSLS